MTAPLPLRMSGGIWQERVKQFRSHFQQLLRKMIPPGAVKTDDAFDNDEECRRVYSTLKGYFEPVAEGQRKFR
jgi:hypothetical protein